MVTVHLSDEYGNVLNGLVQFGNEVKETKEGRVSFVAPLENTSIIIRGFVKGLRTESIKLPVQVNTMRDITLIAKRV